MIMEFPKRLQSYNEFYM